MSEVSDKIVGEVNQFASDVRCTNSTISIHQYLTCLTIQSVLRLLFISRIVFAISKLTIDFAVVWRVALTGRPDGRHLGPCVAAWSRRAGPSQCACKKTTEPTDDSNGPTVTLNPKPKLATGGAGGLFYIRRPRRAVSSAHVAPLLLSWS